MIQAFLTLNAIKLLSELESRWRTHPGKYWPEQKVLEAVFNISGGWEWQYIEELLVQELIQRNKYEEIRYNSLGPT